MTFEEFQASATRVFDLRRLAGARDFFEDAACPIPGIVYAGDLWIERCGAMYLLTLANTQFESYDRAELERELFDYATRAGVFE